MRRRSEDEHDSRGTRRVAVRPRSVTAEQARLTARQLVAINAVPIPPSLAPLGVIAMPEPALDESSIDPSCREALHAVWESSCHPQTYWRDHCSSRPLTICIFIGPPDLSTEPARQMVSCVPVSQTADLDPRRCAHYHLLDRLHTAIGLGAR
jgi:hypothetical protein